MKKFLKWLKNLFKKPEPLEPLFEIPYHPNCRCSLEVRDVKMGSGFIRYTTKPDERAKVSFRPKPKKKRKAKARRKK